MVKNAMDDLPVATYKKINIG